jgi:hypothetical protein
MPELDELSTKSTLTLRMHTIRSAARLPGTSTRRSKLNVEWRDHFVEWRKTLSDVLLAFQPRTCDDRELGRRRNVGPSLHPIDSRRLRGRRVVPGDLRLAI